MMASAATLILLIAGVLLARWHGRDRKRTLEAWGVEGPDLPRGREMFGVLLPAVAMAAVAIGNPGAGSASRGPLMLVVDVSRSMGARDGEGGAGSTRLDEARARLAEALGEEGENREIGLVVFATRAALALPPTPDREALARSLAALTPAPAELGGGSRPGPALSLARLALPTKGKGSLWLVTDGEFHGSDARPAARALARHLDTVRVFTVGSSAAAPVPGPGGGPFPSAARAALTRRDSAAADALGRAMGVQEKPRPASRMTAPLADLLRLLTLVACLMLWLRIPLRATASARRAAAAVLATVLLSGSTWASWPDLWAGHEAWQRGEPEVAAMHYQRALKRQDPHPAARYDLGCVELARGRLSEARTQFVQAARQPGATRRLKASCAYNLGIVEGRSGRWQEAAMAFRQSLALQPGDADARHNLAVAEAHLQSPQASTEATSEARRTLAAALARDSRPRPASTMPRPGEGPSETTPDW
ncbi:MAG: VWA domain-containing protein [Candidatus Sericytochromatia bacterium]|nr:VWA domain-containing protein [Candidatus Sericytochromatia bacterium]